MAKQTQTPQAQDEAQIMLNKSEAFVTKYGKQLIAAVVVIIVAVLGFIAFQNFSASKAEEASTALAPCQQYFMEQKFEEALNGDKKSCKGFINVAKEYSSTKAGNLAQLYAGLCCAQLQKWEDAKKYLENFDPEDDKMVSPAALNALATAYANTKDLDKAVDTYKKAAALADSRMDTGVNNSESPTFLLAAAEILMSQNKTEDALAIYKEIKTKYVNSTASQEIDKYIERASQK